MGSTANWMFDPPVSTPTRRMQAKASSRMAWYSTSDSVWAGATVMESPVCTPMGSRFSIEQTTTQLSARSRMTSSSYSFQPAIERSMRICEMGLAARPSAAARASSSRSWAVPVPAPPRMKLGRTMSGKPIRSPTAMASSRDQANPDDGTSRPMLLHGRLELVAVLGRGDGLGVGADELHPVLLEHTPLDQGHGQVEPGLPSERGQQGVGTFALDDGGQDVGVEGLDVGAVGQFGVGHDRGRVGVGQHHRVSLGPQHPARLGPRVVELAGLADDDGTGADHQDLLDVGTARHSGPLHCRMRSPEVGEEVAGVVGARTRLGVVLHAEGRNRRTAESFDHAVVQVHVGELGASGPVVGREATSTA